MPRFVIFLVECGETLGDLVREMDAAVRRVTFDAPVVVSWDFDGDEGTSAED